jgi:hypothetical protein
MDLRTLDSADLKTLEIEENQVKYREIQKH